MSTVAPWMLHDYWTIAVRSKWLIAGIVLSSLAVAVTLCLVGPQSYRSSTLILVEDQMIPEDSVKALVGGSMEERLTMIQQEVMSRTLLSGAIDEFKLYQKDLQRDGVESVIEGMRRAIRVEAVGTTGAQGKRVEAFSISFAHENPMTAMRVTAKLASQLIEVNRRVREQLVEGASNFLEQELRTAQERLQTQKQMISGFKTKFMGELPQQMEANLRALDRLQIDLNVTSESLTDRTSRYAMIEKGIADYKATGTASPDVTGELLKAQLEEKAGRDGSGDNGAMGKAVDPFLQSLVRQLEEMRIEIAGLKDRWNRLTGQIKMYEGLVERAPAREQELMVLLRDYENMQKNYQALLEKKLNSRVAENLEKREKGEQVRIIAPANLPEKSEGPDPMRIILIGLAIGCGLGFGAAFAKDRLGPSFRRPEEAETL